MKKNTAHTAHMRLRKVLEMPAMTIDDLDGWVADHYLTMDPGPSRTAQQFVLIITDLSDGNGTIPDYLRNQIDPDSIAPRTDLEDRVFIRFEYKKGGIVTIYPSPAPTPEEVSQAMDEAAAHFAASDWLALCATMPAMA